MKSKFKAIPKTTIRIYTIDLHHIKILAAVANVSPIDTVAQMVKVAIAQNPQILKLTNNNIHGAVDRFSE